MCQVCYLTIRSVLGYNVIDQHSIGHASTRYGVSKMQCPACNTINLPTHRFCGECGAELPISRTKPLPHQGERRQVTVLLADIAGFTALSENLDPEQVTSFVNQCFRVMVPVVEEFGGHVDTYLGDALLALFGTAVAHEDDPARAVRCGLAMCEQFNRFVNAQQPLAGARVGLHIGINTGLAVTGQTQVGGAGRQFSVMGDTVNFAAEVEQLAGAGEVAVSEATYRFTAPLFRWEQRGSTSGKGRNQQMRVYRVVEAVGESNQIRGLEGLHAPLIGRDIEIAAIREMIGHIEQRGAVAAVFGDPGLGKSRLLAELRAFVSSEPGIIWAEGRCLSYGQPPDYYPWRNVIRRLCGLQEQDTGALQHELQAKLAGLVEQSDEVYTGLCRLLGIGGATGSEAESRRLIAYSVQRLLDALTLRQPLIIALDDLHWADQPSLTLFDTLMAKPPRPGLLIIGCSRSDGSGGEQTLRQAVADAQAVTFTLQPLNQSDSSELVSALLRVEGMPARLRQLILTRADGVPFYVEEVIRSMIDSGAIYRDGEVWRARDDADSVEVPPTLVGVISARVDALDPAARHALQVAAVLGRRFDIAALAAMLDETTDSANLQAMLTVLQYREMVRPVGDGEYSFKHALTQQVAYSTLLHTERRQRHHTAGDYYAAQLLPLQPSAIADLRPVFDAHYHYVQAQDYTAAYALTNRIIAQREGDLQLTLDDALDRWGENAARRPLYQPLTNHLWGSDAAGAWGRLGHANERLGELGLALECYQQAVKLSDDNDDFFAQGMWLGYLGTAYFREGNAQASLVQYSRALALAVQLEELGLQGRWLNSIGNVYRTLGQLQDALTCYNQGLDIARQLGDRRTEGVCLGNLGLVLQMMGDKVQPISYYERALVIAQEANDRRNQCIWLGGLGFIYSVMGEAEIAIDYYSQAIAITLQIGDRHTLAIWLGYLSNIYCVLDDLEQALSHAKRSLEIAEQIGSRSLQTEAYCALASTYYRQQHAELAFSHYSQAHDLATAIGRTELRTLAASGIARIKALQGDRDAARQLLDELCYSETDKVNGSDQFRYNIACTLALLDDCVGAIAIVRTVLKSNALYCDYARTDPDLATCL